MKLIVGVADMKISNSHGDVIVTHALGSCLGIAVHDAEAGVGGLLHVMMPMSNINPEKARNNPFMFVDTGVPRFFRKIYEYGGEKKRLKIHVAGGANVQGNGNDRFAIGKRNFVVLKKVFWQNGIMISGEDVGGVHARTMFLEVGSGACWLSTGGAKRELSTA